MLEMTSARYVKTARTQLGLTQGEFARELGLNRHTIMRYEQGYVLPERSRLAIAQLLIKRKQRRR